MFSEDEMLPISALHHIVFCPRQTALMFIECQWDENRFTAEGSVFHEHTDTPGTDLRGDIRIARSLRVQSRTLGVSGIIDVVEFRRCPDDGKSPPAHSAIPLPRVDGLWMPFPVEYKRGVLKQRLGYMVQLCAQAMCLEEMLNVTVTGGAIFYGKPRRRLAVNFDDTLRKQTQSAAVELRNLVTAGVTPKARYEKKCDTCSLLDICIPKATGPKRSVRSFITRMLYNKNVQNEET